MISQSQIYHWIAKGSHPSERLGGAFKIKENQNKVVVDDRLSSWQAAFKQTKWSLDEILEKRNLTQKDWQQSVLDVEVIDASLLPSWAKYFYQIFTHWNQLNSEGKTLESCFDFPKLSNQFGYHWAVLARFRLDNCLSKLQKDNIYLEQAAISDVLMYLISRLYKPTISTISQPLAGHQSEASKEAYKNKPAFELWVSAFDRAPVLTAMIGEICQDWEVATTEMLQRLQSDLPIIKQTFWTNTNNQNKLIIKRLKCGLGDPHRGGRSVAIVQTNMGDVVYKPKKLIGTEAIGRLLTTLHKINPNTTPLTPKFINQGDYGWEERVVAKSCNNQTEVKYFYQRLGGWLRLLQVLNANDFWYDNLIASGDMPYFIDYETIIGVLGMGQYDCAAGHLGYIGVLPFFSPSYNKEENPIDICCLVSPGVQRTPLQILLDTQQSIELEAHDFAATLEGKFEDINAYFDEFQSGFKSMNDLLMSSAGNTAINQLLSDISKARFRHIFIDTWSAYSFIDNLNQYFITDGVRRAIAHDALFKALPYLDYKVVESAVTSIRVNDIPIYEIDAYSTNAYTFDNQVIPGVFNKSPIAYVQENIARLDEVEYDLDYVRSIYALRSDRPKRPYQQTNNIDTYKPLEVANQIGHFFIQLLKDENYSKGYYIALSKSLGHHSLMPIQQSSEAVTAWIILFTKLYHQSKQQQYLDQLSILYDRLLSVEGMFVDSDDTYGLLGSWSMHIIAYHHVSEWFEVNKPIHQAYQNILEILKKTHTLSSDYRFGVSGLLDVLAFSRTCGLEVDVYYQQIKQKLTHKRLTLIKRPAMLSDYLDDILPGQYWGIQLATKHLSDETLSQKLQSVLPDKPNKASLSDLSVQGYLLDESTLKLSQDLIALTPESLPKASVREITNLLYAQLYLKKYGHLKQDNIHELSLILVNRFHDNKQWLCDTWFEDKHLVSAQGGLVDIALVFLAQHNNNDMLNPMRMMELN